MCYHPRIESSEYASFQTTRSRNSRLWFINNPKLEHAILGYAAKCVDRYSVQLYALAIEGNHIQAPAHFPQANRASFMRDFNSSVARAVPRYCPDYDGGLFWGRRYSSELLPDNADIEDRFFYTVLQPVQDGQVERLSEYPGYNCFHDAIWGIKRKFKVIKWAEYNAKKRYDRSVSIKDFTQVVTLEYTRIPGYEQMGREEYAAMMLKKLEQRRQEIVKQRYAQGLGFAGTEALLRKRPGAYPYRTKKSHRYSRRPRVLSICPMRWASTMKWYFDIYFWYKEASRRYRTGELDVEFPPGTYRPYCGPVAPVPG